LRSREITNETQQALRAEQKLYDIRLSFASDGSGFGKQFTERTRNVDTRVSLIQGRLLHFKGRYETDTDGETRGAQAHYFECRATDEDIAKVIQTPIPDSLTDEEKAAATSSLAEAQRVLLVTKENATYWLGLMAFDRGNYAVASDWFQRYLGGKSTRNWATGAHDNLGRAYEASALSIDEKSSTPGMSEEKIELLRKARAAYEANLGTPLAAQAKFRLQQLDKLLP
jgi:hypothetical protein